MLIRIHTVQPAVLLPIPVLLEVNISRGIKFHVSGNVHTSIKENRQRVYATLKNEGWHWPGQRITLNFRPLELLKKGNHYDLAIAIGILGASGQISTELTNNTLFYGALNLDGTVEQAEHAFQILEVAKRNNFKRVVLNISNKYINRINAQFLNIEIINIESFKEVIAYLQHAVLPEIKDLEEVDIDKKRSLCFSDVKGLTSIKRALEIAAAGGHHILIKGSPGIGKTMLLDRFSSILPQINPADRALISVLSKIDESLTSGSRPIVKSVAEETVKSLFGSKEIQALKDHFQVADGIGFIDNEVLAISKGVLGKFHLALGGVLCFDELPTLSRAVLDAITLHMDCYRVQMIMAMNPCHCGYFDHPEVECSCSASNLHRYDGALSGALLDRIDLQVAHNQVEEKGKLETSATIAARVRLAFERQLKRSETQNARLSIDTLKQLILSNDAMKLEFQKLTIKNSWSLRKQRIVLCTALTIADLDDCSPKVEHLLEAVKFSSFHLLDSTNKVEKQKYSRPSVILGANLKIEEP